MPRNNGSRAAVSRRTLLARIGWGSAAVLTMNPTIACSRPDSDGQGSGDDDALLARILAEAEPFIGRRDEPYRITRTLLIDAGKTVRIEPDTRILWAGIVQDEARPVAVFEAAGDDTALVAAGEGEAFIESEVPSPWVYAAAMFGHRGFLVEGIAARNCQHVHVGSSVSAYEAVRTRGADSNIARDVRVQGGGARFTALPSQGNGSCMLAYVSGAHVSDAHYENVSHGVQWWGGDSGLLAWQNGARENERKCSDLLIERVSVRNATVGGIWGSMGRDIQVRDCRVEDCLDVGCNAEGCDEITFERCTSVNGHNGCFTTFALNDGIRFLDCQGSVDNASYPLFRIYNVTQSNADNRNIAVTGGSFDCLDPSGPASMDCARGPVRELAITGARLRNVRIDTVFLNMHRTRVADNELTFTVPLPSQEAAIRAGASQGLPGQIGQAIVDNNTIRYAVQPQRASGDAVAIEMVENDYNANAASQVTGNSVSGPFAVGISLVNASGNPGVVPAFEISGNRFEGLAATARLLSVSREGQASEPGVRWDASQMHDGRAVDLARALGKTRSR